MVLNQQKRNGHENQSYGGVVFDGERVWFLSPLDEALLINGCYFTGLRRLGSSAQLLGLVIFTRAPSVFLDFYFFLVCILLIRFILGYNLQCV